MKKILITAVLTSLIAGVAFADSNVVSSANVVGYVQIDKPTAGLQLMGINWVDSALDDLTSMDQFTGDAAIGQADKITAWDAETQTYVKYALFSDVPYGGSTTEWRSFTNFFGPAVNPVLYSGSAVWITSPNAPSNIALTVSGDVVQEQYITNSIVAGLQMLATPFTSDTTLSNLNFIASGAIGDAAIGQADKITVWDTDAQAYVKYSLFSDVPYGGSTTEWRSFTNFFGTAVNPTLDLGKGFWYTAQSNFNWVVETPYLNNL